MNWILGGLACLSLILLLWQWFAAVRFPLHQRIPVSTFAPAVTLLKSLKGCDLETENCLRSWFTQQYTGNVQLLFGVAASDDPVGEVVKRLLREFPSANAQLIVCGPLAGTNAKVSKLAQLEKLVAHEIIVVSDADVQVPADFLANAVAPLQQSEIGLVNCFYRLANPSTLAMQWEAIAINSDFWSQVLQSKSLKPLDFALGAVMITRRQQLSEIGGFEALMDCLADDYQLGNRIARKGHRIALSTVVVECWDPPMNWRAVWKHQLRWARTIRVCQPLPYFFSILSNAGWWALLWLVAGFFSFIKNVHLNSTDRGFALHLIIPSGLLPAAVCLVVRMLIAFDLQRRLTRSTDHAPLFWMVPLKDFLQTAIWLGAFLGNRIEWRGEIYRLRPDGTLEKK